MKPLKVFTACCYNDREPIRVLQESCDILGLDFSCYGEAHSWTNTKTIKITLALEYLNTIKDEYEVVLYTDGSDSFMMAGEDEILEKFYNQVPYGGVLGSGNIDCWPDPDLIEVYPEAPTQWRMISPGGWMGTMKRAISMLEVLQHTHHTNDTPAWHDLFLRKTHRMKVDHYCWIFQNISGEVPNRIAWKEGRLVNMDTHATPCVAHWSGRLPGMGVAFKEWKDARS